MSRAILLVVGLSENDKGEQLLSFIILVRAEGLEPPYREVLDPKSSVSTNFTTPAA